MNPQLNRAAGRLFPRVLAEYAYMVPDPLPADEVPGSVGRCLMARLPFRGRRSGSFLLVLPETLAVLIAASTLGIEITDPQALARSKDAVKELASVLGGYWSSAVESLLPNLELEPPEVYVLGDTDWDWLRRIPNLQCFAVREETALLRVQLEPGRDVA